MKAPLDWKYVHFWPVCFMPSWREFLWTAVDSYGQQLHLLIQNDHISSTGTPFSMAGSDMYTMGILYSIYLILLKRWELVKQLCVTELPYYWPKYSLAAHSVSSHNLIQSWLIGNYTPGNKLNKFESNRHTLFEDAFENFLCIIASSLSRLQCVKGEAATHVIIQQTTCKREFILSLIIICKKMFTK